MANNFKRTNLAANTEADNIATLLNTGYMKIYSGTQPATADTALSGNTLLATLRFNATAAGASVNGVATYNAITSDTNAAATGTASFFRALKSDNATSVYDGSVGTSNADAIINSTAIQSGTTVSCSSFTYTANKG